MTPNKVILITGAAKRLGRSIAEHFAKHDWNIAIHYHTSLTEAQNTHAMLAKTAQQHHSLYAADLSIPSEVVNLYQQVQTTYGRVDAIINNASVFHLDTLESITPESFQQHLVPNLLAPLLLAQSHLKFCKSHAHKGSCIVNILDQKLWNPNPDFLSYTLSKAGLEQANTLLAQAMSPSIRVIGVAPGMTLPSHLQTSEQFAKAHRLSPLGHASRPEDIAETVFFAVNSPAITGTSIIVDGGQHLQKFERDFSLMNL